MTYEKSTGHKADGRSDNVDIFPKLSTRIEPAMNTHNGHHILK